MKKLLLLLSTVLLFSCENYNKQNICYKMNVVLLNKDITHDAGGGTFYHFYIYNGTESNWFDTNENTYNSYQQGDTLSSIFIHTIQTLK